MTIRLHTALPLAQSLRLLSTLFVAAGAIGVGAYLWSEADRRLYEYAHLDSVDLPMPAPAAPLPPSQQHPPMARTAPAAVEPSAPFVVGQIEIPALGLKAVVRKGIDATTLRRAVGHVPGTALPGEDGNAVLAGHRDTVFAGLKGIERGHLIRLKRRGSLTATYQVDHLAIVETNALEVMQPTAGKRLTLITCYPFEFLGPSPRRLIVGASALP